MARVALIWLRDGEAAIVDRDCVEMLNLNKWAWHKRKDGYVARYSSKRIDGRVKSFTVMMHRFIMGLDQDDPREVDHKNGNGIDNRRSNLRICTHALNTQNVPAHRDSKTGIRGVEKTRNGYRAVVCVSGIKHRSGQFDTSEAAGEEARKMRSELMEYGSEAR